MRKLRSLLPLCALFILSSCAQIVAPTGGEKDISPPETLRIEPANQSLMFAAKEVEIEFNEFVRLVNLKEELIVSPPLKYDLETKIKGKTLVLAIKDTLEANTTYVFNFGNAIVDISEGNPIQNFQYVFSTGNTIDSLQLSGKIVDAFQLTAPEAMMVMLYSNTEEDSLPLKELPDYLSRSDKEGLFTITNIKEGSYRLFALKDANKNFLFDRPDEMIAFSSAIIEMEDHKKDIRLYAFTEDRQKQFIEKQTEKEAQLILDFKKPIDSLYFFGTDTALQTLLLDFQINEPGRDTAIFWWKELDNRKTRMAIFDDTLFADTIQFKIDSLSKKKHLKLRSQLSGKRNFFEPISLVFERPLTNIDTSLISIRDFDSTLVPFLVKKDTLFRQRAQLSFSFKEDSSYQIEILPGAFTDIYEQSTDTISARFSFNKARDFGTLLLSINYKDSLPKIVQLTSNGKVLREQLSQNNSVTFTYLKGGTYGLKLILDSNNNGKWDTGDYLKKQSPEKVVIYNEPIVIRSNWDKEIEWVIQAANE